MYNFSGYESQGIYPALVTPYDTKGGVDTEAIQQLVEKLVADGADGFYLTGSTGECFFLSHEERCNVVKTAVKAINGRAAVIVHVGEISTEHAILNAKVAQECGADAISAIPPFYYKYSFEEIREHYYKIMDSTSLPMFIYNFPALSGIQFTMEQLKSLGEHKNFAGIKHTSQDLFQMQQIKTSLPDKIIFNGYDEMFLGGLSMGCDGAIGSTFNIMTPRYKKIMKLFKENRLKEAQEEQWKANEIISALIFAGVNQGIKYLLKDCGIECNGCRMPMKPIDKAGMERMDGVRHLVKC